MKPSRATKLFAGLLVVLAMPDLALAQDVSNAPTVSHPSSRTVSPRLSDLPDAHWHGSPMDLKVHPRPLLPALPERAAVRPSTSDLALQSKPGAALTPASKTAFGGIGANGSIPGDPNIAVGQTNPLTGANTTTTVSFASEAGLYQQAGIPAIVCGPGSIDVAHKPDEFITRAELADGQTFLHRLLQWARTGG